MVLILQVGVVLLAASVAAIAWSRSKPSPTAVARAIAIFALAFGYLAFWGKVWHTSGSFLSERSRSGKLTPHQAVDAGAPPGVQGHFAEWIRSRLEPGQRFYLVQLPTRDDSVYQWFTYRLLPNLETERPQRADWLIFYRTSPRASGYVHLIKGVAAQYAPGYSIAKVRHAS